MPEYPDVVVYLESLEPRIVGKTIDGFLGKSPFLVRTFDPPIEEIVGKKVLSLERIGKRLVWELEDDLFLVIHLMIAGRLRWRPPGTKPTGKIALATFNFEGGTLLFTEASSQKRASLHLVRGRDALAALDPGGLELFDCTAEEFAERLRLRNHTLRRALTDPKLFSGIGNAYSDEILHHARLSPVALTQKLDDEKVERLFASIRRVLTDWTDRLRAAVGDGFPEKVTAFRPEMAVHGRAGEPCPDCGEAIQRIVFAANETNYCAQCQTGGKLLADRALSRLLKKDWPKTLEELEEHRQSLNDELGPPA